MEQQCPFWISTAGCRDPSQCQKGRHDPAWKGIKDRKLGKGGDPASPIAGQPGKGDKGGKGKGKADEKGAKGDRKKANGNTPNPKSQARPTGPPHKKLADDAITDLNGKPLCYAFMNAKCWDPCPKGKYHGTPTPAMFEKMKRDQEKLSRKRASGEEATQSDADSGTEGQTPKAKAKAKTKQGGKDQAVPK